MLRVLVVDDSPTARDILTAILDSDPDIEVVGCACDGQEGVAMVKRLHPDLVTMDIMMPKMDGFEATKEIMIERPTPIVVISASTRIQEVETAMKALRAGALTLLKKPLGPNSPGFDKAAQHVITMVKTMVEVKVIRHHRYVGHVDVSDATRPAAEPRLVEETFRRDGFRAVAIAASTGGPPALSTLLSKLPADFPLPIFIVQHIAFGFIEGFTNWLDSVVPMTVNLAQHDALSTPGNVYVAPHDCHLGITCGGRIKLHGEAAVDGFRPSASFLFRSVAEAFGEKTIAVMLTGMGSDGVEGLRDVRQAGGVIIAQDKDSSVVFGMPRVAIEEGLVDTILPIDEISKHLMELVDCRVTSTR